MRLVDLKFWFIKCIIICITLISIVIKSYAGAGWISSGGEIFRLDKNPWFVKKTENVNYCIDFDESAMTIDYNRAKEAIIESLSFWKSDFERSQNNVLARGFAKLGTQNFTFQDKCDSNSLLEFKFGIGSLKTKEEIDYFPDPTKYVGVSVRTSYDEVNMEGKGFIYISGDKGEGAYKNNGHMVEEAWSKKNLLKYALIHELGHVFGISHSGTGLMSEVFMDQLLHKKISQDFIDGKTQSYLHPDKTMKVCLPFGDFDPNFFGLTPKSQCVILIEKSVSNYLVYSVDQGSDQQVEIGELKLIEPSDKGIIPKPVTLIHLPENQNVFDLQERFLATYMSGPLFTNTAGVGAYYKKGSMKPNKVYLDIKPEGLTLIGSTQKPVFVYVKMSKQLF